MVTHQGFTHNRKFEDRTTLPACYHIELFCSMFNFHLNAHRLALHRQNSKLERLQFCLWELQADCLRLRTIKHPGRFIFSWLLQRAIQLWCWKILFVHKTSGKNCYPYSVDSFWQIFRRRVFSSYFRVITA